jgi:hypothetical protein
MQDEFRNKVKAHQNKLRDPRIKERFMKTNFFYPISSDNDVPKGHKEKNSQDRSAKKRMKISINNSNVVRDTDKAFIQSNIVKE